MCLPHPVVSLAATNTCYIKLLRLPLTLCFSFRFSLAKKTKLPYSFALLKHKIFKNLFHVRSPCEEIIYDNVYLHSGKISEKCKKDKERGRVFVIAKCWRMSSKISPYEHHKELTKFGQGLELFSEGLN